MLSDIYTRFCNDPLLQSLAGGFAIFLALMLALIRVGKTQDKS